MVSQIAEEDKKSPGAFPSERNYCSIEHTQSITAYCVKCKTYICEACQIEVHAYHEIHHLEAECLRIFSEYKKFQYETQAIAKQYKMQSIDKVVASLRAQISSKFDELISQIIGLKERRIRELLDSEELRSTINESLMQDEHTLVVLQGIQTDAEKLMEQIKSDFDNRRYIPLFERNAAQELAQLRKRIQEWKALLSNSKLGDLGINISFNMTGLEHKLSSLIGISYVSRPSPQFIYSFDNENNKLLLYDMQKRTTQLLCFGAHFHIPFHYSSAILDTKIYFAGGDDDGYRKDCYALSFTKKYVQKLDDLNVERRNHTLVALHIVRVMYCVGGYNKRRGALNSVEKYDFANPHWICVAPLVEKRQWPAVCQFNNKLIFCFGGSNLGTVERFDVLNEDLGWELVGIKENTANWYGRSACVAIQMNATQILIFGGCARRDLDETVVYTPGAETLAPCASLPVPSLFCQLAPAISAQHVGIIGWRNENIYLFDIKKKDWTYIEPTVYCPSDFAPN